MARSKAGSKALRNVATISDSAGWASSFFVRNACHRACRDGSVTNSLVRPMGSEAGTANATSSEGGCDCPGQDLGVQDFAVQQD